MSAQSMLRSLVDSCHPTHLLTCGSLANELGQRWQQAQDTANLLQLESSEAGKTLDLAQTPDLALVTDTLEHVDYEQGRLLLGQLRNLGSHQIAVLVADCRHWPFRAFIGLGFRRQQRLEENGQSYTVYTYNIDTYNRKRDWNNPKNWANPEMWDKARW